MNGVSFAESFIDSNVIICLFEDVDLEKRDSAATLIDQLLAARRACISFQVVQEVLNAVTRKIEHPAALDESERLLNSVLAPLWTVMPSRALYERAFHVHARYRYSFYDSLIIAAALEAGCTRLLTEDMQDGQRIETLTIVNPFASA